MAALNPMAAFGMAGSGAVAAAAAAAAAAVFGHAQNAGAGGAGGVGNAANALASGRNLLLNLNIPSFSYPLNNNNPNNNPASAASSSSSCDYHTDRAEWMSRIENSHIDRTLMNRLVMNYLVTGKFTFLSNFQLFSLLFTLMFSFQRGLKKQLINSVPKPALTISTTLSR
jgi:hypothetical protein